MLERYGNPMHGAWAVDGDTVHLYVDAANQFLGYVLKSPSGDVIADNTRLRPNGMQINIRELEAARWLR